MCDQSARRYLCVYCDYTRGVCGVCLGWYEGRDMRAEMPIPVGECRFEPSPEQLLELVEQAVENWHTAP